MKNIHVFSIFTSKATEYLNNNFIMDFFLKVEIILILNIFQGDFNVLIFFTLERYSWRTFFMNLSLEVNGDFSVLIWNCGKCGIFGGE